MPEKTMTPKMPTPPAGPTPLDLSKEIAAALEKGPGETVKCIHVFGDNYRCNWWGPSEERTPVLVQRVHRSRLLKVKKTADGLTMQELTGSKA